jgi:DNA-binding NarL/FixJ family response regulator
MSIRFETISIFLIDDHTIFSQSFQAFVSTQPEFEWKGSSQGGGRTVLDILHIRPRVVLIDYHLKGENGLELLRKLRDAGFQELLILLTMNREKHVQTAARMNGANGFVSKDADGLDLLYGIRDLATGNIQYLHLPHADPEKAGSPFRLTQQEQRIAELVCAGMNSDAIAASLQISIHTVHTHRRRILEKTGSTNFFEVCHKLA